MFENLKYYQVDINNIIIESFLKENIYIVLLSKVDILLDQCLRILQNLYRLKQTVRDWHERYIKKIVKLDFKQCDVNLYLLIYL